MEPKDARVVSKKGQKADIISTYFDLAVFILVHGTKVEFLFGAKTILVLNFTSPTSSAH